MQQVRTQLVHPEEKGVLQLTDGKHVFVRQYKVGGVTTSIAHLRQSKVQDLRLLADIDSTGP